MYYVKCELASAPQVQGIQPPGVVHIPIGTTAEGTYVVESARWALKSTWELAHLA